MLHRTDVGKIQYPSGLTASNRRHCRRMITAVANEIEVMNKVVVACSGGIDSTVLAHALGQAIRIRPNTSSGKKIEATAVYVNHGLRPTEVVAEAAHVKQLCKHLTFEGPQLLAKVEKGSKLQERAREARYSILEKFCSTLHEEDPSGFVLLMLGHNANDNAETILFTFLKGKAQPIPRFRRLVMPPRGLFLTRPLLSFTREDIKRYADSFGLSWHTDSSNGEDGYTRNKIRHHLIPWIEQNVNPNVVKTLAGEK